MARTKPPKQSFAKDSRTSHSSDSSISSFHPALPLFASAILSLDSWHIRVIDPNTSSSRNDYTLESGLTCRCLAWGTVSHSRNSEKSKKKRKIDQRAEEGILAAGTSDGSIHIYSPSEDDKVVKLDGGHTGEVTSLCFTDSSIWSAGTDGKAIEWDINTHTILQSLIVDSENPLKAISFNSTDLLAASYTIHHMTFPGSVSQTKFTNHTSPVHSLVFGPEKRFLSAADDDRHMNTFSIEKSAHEKTLIAESDVKKISYRNGILCVVTVEGSVELFNDAFTPATAFSNKRRKSQIATAKSKVRIVRPDLTTVQILDISIRSDDTLILVWTEAARIVFEAIKLRVEGEIIDSTELVRAVLPTMGLVNGTKEKQKKVYQDGNANLVAGNDTGDLEIQENFANGTNDHGSGSSSEEEGEEAPEEPTLADRLHTLEVSATTPAKVNNPTRAVLKMPSAGSLTTVLTQALKSNDTALLESCLHHSDSKVILATIRRLDPTLAVSLLEQVASRISRRPGRSADLGVWVRWTIVVHGGYLASLPKLVRTLSSLHSVLSSRAAALPRLLALQGRLEMVNAQIELRQEGGIKSSNGEDPSDVEYIEGESDMSDEEEIGVEDASQFGGLDTSDEESDADEEIEDDGDFSEDSGDGNEFAELDASMEMMQQDDLDTEHVSDASDDDA